MPDTGAPSVTKQTHSNFAHRLITWQLAHGRHDLPWQQSVNAYRVWVSEVMLQQTQVATVKDYFIRFMKAFPDVHALAQASNQAVLNLWSGLGYYRRAKYLHQAAIIIVERFHGQFPQDQNLLETLPGVGRSTAAAIMSLAFKQSAVICDGNVKRVLARHQGLEAQQTAKAHRQLWEMAQTLTPLEQTDVYNQGIMDLGAMICKRRHPLCGQCPLHADCQAYQRGQFTLSPVIRPKVSKRRLYYDWLIIQHKGHVWLEQSNDSGIWPGLWHCPMIDSIDTFISNRGASWLDQSQIVRCQDLDFDHQLTHQYWQVSVYHLQLDSRANRPSLSEGRWQRPEDFEQLPIPAPLKKMQKKLMDLIHVV